MNTNEKRFNVLILCKDYPPSNNVGGKRPYGWHQYLGEFGIESTVITATLDDVDIDEANLHRVDCKIEYLKSNIGLSKINIFKRKLRSFFELWLPFVLPFTSRYYPIFKKADYLLQKKKYDLIIATGEPFILFEFAKRLGVNNRIDWILDYRDNWSNEPTSILHKRISVLRKYLSFIERKTLKSALHITTVGITTAERITEINDIPKIHIVENGHNIPASFSNAPSPPDIVVISYLGRFYQHRNPAMFLQGVRAFIEKNTSARLEIRFIGLEDFPIQKNELNAIAGDLNDFIITTPGMAYDEMLQLASESHGFLMLADPELPLTSGKMYDYLGLKRPIILVPDDKSVLRDIIQAENCGFIANSPEEVADVLEMMHNNLDNPEFFETSVDREKYSRREGTRLLAEVIKEIIAKDK